MEARKMNKQIKRHPNGSIRSRGIEYTNVWNNDEAYTCNPIDGCRTGCQWLVEGEWTQCYAKTIAENPKFTSSTFFPTGHFEDIAFHPERLEEVVNHKKRSGVFFSNMSDWMAPQVKEEWKRAIIETAQQCPQHRILTLTKHAPQLLKFKDDYPSNMWIGCSIPASRMFDHDLNSDQQYRDFARSLEVLSEISVPVRWVSAEPLSFNIASLLWDMYYNTPQESQINWIVIGAASNGKQTYQPDPIWLFETMQALDFMGVPIFFKNNLTWTLEMGAHYVENYAPFPHARYGKRREMFPVKALTYTEISPKSGKEVLMLPFGGDRSQECAPILDLYGQPVDPVRFRSNNIEAYLDSLGEEQKEAYLAHLKEMGRKWRREAKLWKAESFVERDTRRK